MPPAFHRPLFWAPRAISVGFILFLSLFALDAFGEGLGFWRTLLAFTIHLIPCFVLIAVLALAWRWEWVGAALYGAAGLLYAGWVAISPHPAPLVRLTWILAVSTPALLIAALFWTNWIRHDELRAP